MMDGPLFALIAIGTAFVLSGALFRRQGEKSATVSAATGLIGNIVWMSIAIFLILGGGDGAFIGFLMLTGLMFLARGNIRVLQESEVRKKIAGQA